MGKSILNGLLTILVLAFFQNTNAQWIQLQGLTSEEVRSLAVDGENIFAGTPTNGLFISTDNGFTWAKNNNGLPNSYIRAVENERDTIYVSCNGILRSTNNGMTWNSLLSGKDVTSLYVHGRELLANVFDIYNGHYSNILVTSSDMGNTWTNILASPTISQYGLVRKIEKIRLGIVVGSTDGVCISADNGNSWNWIFKYRVEALLAYGNILIVGNWGRGIFISADYGNTWSNENNGLYDKDISSLFLKDSLVFAGTHNGNVFVSSNSGKDWNLIGSGLKNSVLSFGINNSYLFVGTDSSGIWRRPLSEIITDTMTNENMPTDFSLSQNYPNPFNPSTKIRYELPATSFVTLKVYNILGREVTTLVNKNESAGIHNVNFDASRLTSGVYIYTINAGNFVQSKKMLLLK